MTRSEIANIIKSMRLESGLTQKEMADQVGKKQQTIASWETGQSQPDANTLFTLCAICGTTVDAAFGFKQKNSPASDESKAGEMSDLKRRAAFRRALVKLGYLREGEDIPDDRLEIAIHALQILDLAFRRADDTVDNTASAG